MLFLRLNPPAGLFFLFLEVATPLPSHGVWQSKTWRRFWEILFSLLPLRGEEEENVARGRRGDGAGGWRRSRGRHRRRAAAAAAASRRCG
ncbi:Os12g0102800 [Oryza sativa Japonica Group]|uniref:Os12g0102800 protein n=1 Tax=Oryza sativa subsp. japonica TaxID=39947 RepID=A0A0P0Y6A1_ORYSJ|nr:hypothetical protein EE612_057270 [Oryza sativa]BAT15462.1 Os12g0102800 [Oryza sativa Japonica Group]